MTRKLALSVVLEGRIAGEFVVDVPSKGGLKALRSPLAYAQSMEPEGVTTVSAVLVTYDPSNPEDVTPYCPPVS